MITAEQIKSIRERLETLKRCLDIDGKRAVVAAKESESQAPDFWNDPDRANSKMKELKNMKDTIGLSRKLNTQYDDILTLIELGDESDDESMVEEVRSELDEFIEELEELRINTLLSEEYDKCNAILELNAGAGGTESCDWCSMLYRMYTRWAERHGFSVEVLDMLDGDEAGIKSVTFQINGVNAYGYMKSEAGVHRLVRVSPFDSTISRAKILLSDMLLLMIR